MFFGSLGAGEDIFLIDTRPANFHAQGLDPEDYLTEVIRRLPHDPTPEQASALTPVRIADERRVRAETRQIAWTAALPRSPTRTNCRGSI
jgi:hypothetical protein